LHCRLLSIPEDKFLAKNSFGTEWGDNGYCWIPFDYAENYIFDRWVLMLTINK
jgi:C1A family cysteine protease